VSQNTQKPCQNPPVFASHSGDKKTRAPNRHFQPGISDSSFEGAKTIRLAPLVNRLFASRFLPQRGGLTRIYQRPPKLQEIFSLFFAVQSGLFIALFQAALG
jgi:hypothetical protein